MSCADHAAVCAAVPARRQLFQCWRVVDGLMRLSELRQHRHPGPEQHARRVSELLSSLLTVTSVGRTSLMCACAP